MMKNWIIVGLVTTVIMLATLGAVISAQDVDTEPVADDMDVYEDSYFEDELFDEEVLDENVYYLVTIEDQEEIREVAEQMLAEAIHENLEASDLTDEEIMEIEEQIEAIKTLRTEARETMRELREQGATPEEIRAEMEPIMRELRNLQEELRETLREHGIRMFEGRGPGWRMNRLGEGGCGSQRGGRQMFRERMGDREFPGPRP